MTVTLLGYFASDLLPLTEASERSRNLTFTLKLLHPVRCGREDADALLNYETRNRMIGDALDSLVHVS